MSNVTFTIDTALATPLGIEVGDSVSFRADVSKWTTDADGVSFYVSQLSYLESKWYEAKYTAINFDELIPVNTSIPEWADEWEYMSFDGVTLGKFIGSSADDLPRIAVAGNKSKVPIGYAGNSFEYSLDELRKSQQMNLPLDATYGKLANRGAQEHTQRVAYFGDADRNMTGLFNNPNLALDNSTVDWSTATGQEIVADMNSLGTKVWIDSANTHLPDTWVLDSDRYAQITEQRMDSGTDTTVYEFFLKNNIYTAVTGRTPKVVPRLQLKGTGVGGADRMMAYELNDENLSMANPIPWRPLAPQPQGLNINVPCEYKISGVEFRYPFSGAYRDHIVP